MSQPARDAVVYDHIWTTEPIRPASGTVRELLALLQAVGIERALPVLDVGCGAGRHLMAALDAGFDVVGVDHSSAAIQATRRNLSDMPQSSRAKATLVTADAFAWLEGAPSQSVCATICHDVMHHNCCDTRQLTRRLERLASVIAPGGYLAVTLLTDISYSAAQVPPDRLNLTAAEGRHWLDDVLGRHELVRQGTKAFKVQETVSLAGDGSLVTTTYSATRISQLRRI